MPYPRQTSVYRRDTACPAKEAVVGRAENASDSGAGLGDAGVVTETPA